MSENIKYICEMVGREIRKVLSALNVKNISQ
jgi:hypothetical protein